MKSNLQVGRTQLRWIEGQQAILPWMPALLKHAAGWGQEVAVLQIPHSLSVPMMPRRFPMLMIAEDADDAGAMQLVGAVLVFAYGHALLGCRLLTNADRLGRVGVFGASKDRLSLALLAAESLLERGAALVRLDLLLDPNLTPMMMESVLLLARQEASSLPALAAMPATSRWLRTRVRPFDLPLFLDVNQTFASFGWNTRRNLRRRRRRCEKDFGATFERHANIPPDEFLRFHEACAYRVSKRVAEWRWSTATGANGYLCGLRTSTGEWICLSGGRLLHDTAIVDWQINSPAFATYSVSLAMRGYLMEAFGAEGLQHLYFEGGTAHLMSESFARRTVFQVEVRRPILWLRLLDRFMGRWLPDRAMTRSLFGAKPRGKRLP